MNERPIIFSGPMVRAILDGRKTQTRRVVVPAPALDHPAAPHCVTRPGDRGWVLNDDGKTWRYDGTRDGKPSPMCGPYRCHFGAPGDRLWVKETWRQSFKRTRAENGCTYLADYGHRLDLVSEQNARAYWTWKSSRFMPRWASRLALEVEAIRVERIQEISEADAIAEGVRHFDDAHPLPAGVVGAVADTAREAFHHGWDALNAKRGFGWDANPWVWVVTFRRCQ